MLGTEVNSPVVSAAGVHSSQDGRVNVHTAASPETSHSASPLCLMLGEAVRGRGPVPDGPVCTGSQFPSPSPRNPASGRMPRAVGCPVSKDRGPDQGTLDSRRPAASCGRAVAKASCSDLTLLPDGEGACSRSPSTACAPLTQSPQRPGWRWSRVRGLSPVQAPHSSGARLPEVPELGPSPGGTPGMTFSARGWGLEGPGCCPAAS